MLVLSRSEQQKVLFPSLDISVEVVRIRGRTVSLGIEAPLDIPIRRAEIPGLKSLEFAPDPQSVGEQLAELRKEVRSTVEAAADRMNALHQAMEQLAQATPSQEVTQAQSLLLDLFHHLARLDQAAQPADRAAARSKDGLHALVVEDDANERELLAGFLRLSGFQVITAVDGHDAMNYLSLHALPDMVLLDMCMPGCDGASVVRQIRRQRRLAGMKLFAVSAARPEECGVVTGPQGVNRWFRKPINPEQLVAEVQRELAAPTSAL